MAKSQETWNKKEREKKKMQQKKEKAERKLERKSENAGKSLEDMMAYVDENGNITSTPPDPGKRKAVNADDIEISIPKQRAMDAEEVIRKGVVTFFNETKGFGFIKDLQTQESIFVHVNGLEEAIKENNQVTFEVERGLKGLNAVRVKKAK